MRLAWATDIHLDHTSESARRRFCQSVKEQADALVVTGDIAVSNSLGAMLQEMDSLVQRPIYFVLGNHDFYRGSVAGTRSAVAEAVKGTRMVYLSQAGIVELTPNTALVGHDGWADGRPLVAGFRGYFTGPAKRLPPALCNHRLARKQ